jgi:hypothetical protein
MPIGSLVAVYDLGGGTFDASIVQRTTAGFQLIGEPAGIDNLGGIDFDVQLRQFVYERITRLTEGLDEQDPATLIATTELDRRIENAKVELSGATSTVVLVELPTGVTEIRVTRDEFNGLIRQDIERTVDELERAVTQAEVGPDDLSALLLVGGASRIPLVSEVLGRRFPSRLMVDQDHSKLAVGLGAAITAGSMTRAAAAGWNQAAPARTRSADPAPDPPTPDPPPAQRQGEPGSELRGAHGTLHLSGSGPSGGTEEIPVRISDEGLTGQTDDPLIGAPLVPAVDPFPRDQWLPDDPEDREEEATGFATGSGTGWETVLVLLVIVALVALILVLVPRLG